jgi:hypothetical protein
VKTYSLPEVAEFLCGDSMKEPTRWLTRQIAAGRFTARKVGRQWRMTQADVDAALEVLANTVPAETISVVSEPVARPSKGSMRRRLVVAQ